MTPMNAATRIKPNILSVQQLKFQVIAHVKAYGGDFTRWYVGVADDPERALFEKHGVDRERGVWVFRQAMSFRAVENAQTFFIRALGMQGEPYPADHPTDEVDCLYAYLKDTGGMP
ncbi:MAG: hypothetical protein AAGI37_20915 [Planctomycetota bacterium]